MRAFLENDAIHLVTHLAAHHVIQHVVATLHAVLHVERAAVVQLTTRPQSAHAALAATRLPTQAATHLAALQAVIAVHQAVALAVVLQATAAARLHVQLAVLRLATLRLHVAQHLVVHNAASHVVAAFVVAALAADVKRQIRDEIYIRRTTIYPWWFFCAHLLRKRVASVPQAALSKAGKNIASLAQTRHDIDFESCAPSQFPEVFANVANLFAKAFLI